MPCVDRVAGRRLSRRGLLAGALALLLGGAAPPAQPEGAGAGRVVVANRATRNLSVIDVRTDELIATLPMPDAGEPMYLAFSPQHHRLFVADRANSRAVVFDARTLELVGTVPAGAGVFHCWIDPTERQLWITNDVEASATVIDTLNLTVITTVAMPADLVADGYQPHDVTMSLRDPAAFVTMVAPGRPGHVLRYDTRSFELTARRELGGDPHVSVRHYQPDRVYVMSQVAGLVYVLDSHTLSDMAPALSVPGAHGGDMTRIHAGRHFYTTNLPGGGVGGLVAVDTQDYSQISFTDTPFAVPHNIAVTRNGRKLYLTHSGAGASQVTVYDIEPRTGRPSYRATIEVGLNPFGLTFLP